MTACHTSLLRARAVGCISNDNLDLQFHFTYLGDRGYLGNLYILQHKPLVLSRFPPSNPNHKVIEEFISYLDTDCPGKVTLRRV